MHILVKALILLLGMFSFSPVMALDSSMTTDVNPERTLMVFQVVQNQMVFNDSTVENATLVSPENSTDIHGYGVQLKLKPIASHEFEQLTAASIGKQANIILNGVLISSPIIRSKLGAEFLVTGLTKKQAEQFIKSLKASPK